MAGLGPNAGQAHHFLHYAPHRDAYAVARYHGETRRLYGVLDRVLDGSEYVAGDYSIADMAIWPWLYCHSLHAIRLHDFSSAARYFARIGTRPAAIAAMDGLEVRAMPLDDEARRALFGTAPSDAVAD